MVSNMLFLKNLKMSDGITDAWRKIEETPKQKRERALRLMKYHYEEIGKMIKELEEIAEER